MTAIPLRDCDSVCSTSLTRVAMPRSTLPVMRCSISWGSRPLKVHTRLMTGILISGKMSVGVRSRTTGVNRMMTSAITINVYGRCSAKRTIHIQVFEFLLRDDRKAVVFNDNRRAVHQPGKSQCPRLVQCRRRNSFLGLDRKRRTLVTPSRPATLTEYDTSLPRESHSFHT